MIALLVVLVVWIVIGGFVLRYSSSFSIFSNGPSWFEVVLIFPMALLCHLLDKLNKKK